MNHYWYFISTLPHFSFGSPPPLSVRDFDGLCARFLDSSDLGLMECTDSARKGVKASCLDRSAFLRQYSSWERGTREELATLRSRSLNKAEPWARESSGEAECSKAAQAVLAAPDPLQAELTLESERWDVIERLLSLSQFTVDFLLGYRIKLLIAERCSSFEYRRGLENFKSYYNEITKKAADVASSAMKAESQHD